MPVGHGSRGQRNRPRATHRGQRIARVKGLGEQHRTPGSPFSSPSSSSPSANTAQQRPTMIEIDHYWPISGGNGAEIGPISDTARDRRRPSSSGNRAVTAPIDGTAQ
ncbi:hypothetical protein BHE74_00015398 [Ensete ventricosum]|nr:hypothetical protein BHE74_00015398 [Ensete ventricosum]RZS28551.1 hypothetical protein BHM03_00062155 [Ensete ventricosum]